MTVSSLLDERESAQGTVKGVSDIWRFVEYSFFGLNFIYLIFSSMRVNSLQKSKMSVQFDSLKVYRPLFYSFRRYNLTI